MKKSSAAVPQLHFLASLFSGGLLLLLASCSTGGSTGPEPSPAPPVPDTADAVAPDGVLETVTWNLEWYGSFVNGPSDEELQTNNIIRVVDSLNADLFAFQEVTSQHELDELTARMKGYRGFAAGHIDYENGEDQKTAFVYNTRTIDSLSSGPVEAMQDEYNWAGRLPLYFSFNYSYNGRAVPVYAVVIHAKASDGEASYQRRQAAAQSLHQFLLQQKPNAHIVLLGDYNDDVDESIYQGAETPYQPFVADNDDFRVITRTLSESGRSSTVKYPDTIDHITVSNEMVPFYITGSAAVFEPTGNFIDDYGETTSDHYPVWAKFDITR